MILEKSGKIVLNEFANVFSSNFRTYRNIKILLFISIGHIFYFSYRIIAPPGVHRYLFEFRDFRGIDIPKKEIDVRIDTLGFPGLCDTGSLYAWEYR